jgi:hypothetical protein
MQPPQLLHMCKQHMGTRVLTSGAGPAAMTAEPCTSQSAPAAKLYPVGDAQSEVGGARGGLGGAWQGAACTNNVEHVHKDCHAVLQSAALAVNAQCH